MIRIEQARDEIVDVLRQGILSTVMTPIKDVWKDELRHDEFVVQFADGKVVRLRAVDRIEAVSASTD